MRKLIVVSGGTKGIGKAIIEKFASEGFDVITCARTRQSLDSLKKEIDVKYKVDLHGVVADMGTRHGVDAFANAIVALGRPVDILVNNAGYFEPGLITEEPEGALEKMINTNLYSAYHLTRALARDMKKRRSGHIFSMCSVASLYAYPNGGSYSISKFAMLGFSKVLREELKPYGIRVTAVMAGATLTSSWEGTDLPEDRFMKVQDIADTVFGAYSLSPQAVIEELIIRPQLGDI